MKNDIRLARVTEPPTSVNGYRCKMQALDNNAKYDAICNPSPYGWQMPDINALVYFLDAPYAKRMLGVIHDADVVRPLDDIAVQEEIATSGIPSDPGDSHIGKYGRLSLPYNGDVALRSLGLHGQLFFSQETGTSYFSGDNIDIATLDLPTGITPVHIFTEASGGTGAGDTLYIRANTGPTGATSGSTGSTGATGVTGINLTTIKLDHLGNLTVAAGYGPTGGSGSTAPYVQSSGLDVLANGDIQLFCGASTLGAATVSFLASKSKKELRLNSTGDFYLDVTSIANITAKNVIIKASEIISEATNSIALESSNFVKIKVGDSEVIVSLDGVFIHAPAGKRVQVDNGGDVSWNVVYSKVADAPSIMSFAELGVSKSLMVGS